MCVRFAEVFAHVGNRAAEGCGEELLLLPPLFVDVGEELVDPVVGEALGVEEIHGGVDCSAVPQLVVKAVFASLYECLAAHVVGEGIGDPFIFCRDGGICGFAADGAKRGGRGW